MLVRPDAQTSARRTDSPREDDPGGWARAATQTHGLHLQSHLLLRLCWSAFPERCQGQPILPGLPWLRWRLRPFLSFVAIPWVTSSCTWVDSTGCGPIWAKFGPSLTTCVRVRLKSAKHPAIFCPVSTNFARFGPNFIRFRPALARVRPKCGDRDLIGVRPAQVRMPIWVNSGHGQTGPDVPESPEQQLQFSDSRVQSTRARARSSFTDGAAGDKAARPGFVRRRGGGGGRGCAAHPW